MTILAQTVQLAFKIAIVWTGGFLLAVAVNALLPDKLGITLYAESLPCWYPSIGLDSGPVFWRR